MNKQTILFIHQNFPGQFKHLAQALGKLGHNVIALSISGSNVLGVQHFKYGVSGRNTKGIHPLVLDMETKVIRGEACLRAMLQLKDKGVKPDLIVGHPGWGETLFCKLAFPNTPLLHFIEFYYKAIGGDSNFDPEFQANSMDMSIRVETKNLNNLAALQNMDFGLSPTQWQKSTMPAIYQPRTRVIFDGVDTQWIKPDHAAQFTLPGQNRTLTGQNEVVTFINRNMEPYRGYHQFMRALPKLLRDRPKAEVVIVGGDDVSYGSAPPKGTTWKQVFLDEVKDRIDLNRVHYTGRLAHSELLKLYQISSCHVYLTYPFVLSWSCVEALSAGCVVVGSDTEPVREFIRHGENGYLVDFFDPEALASQVSWVLGHPDKQQTIRQKARDSVVQGYDLTTVCLPEQLAYLERILHTRLQ